MSNYQQPLAEVRPQRGSAGESRGFAAPHFKKHLLIGQPVMTLIINPLLDFPRRSLQPLPRPGRATVIGGSGASSEGRPGRRLWGPL